MLKIKDNVDLKELEKFEFLKKGNIYIKKLLPSNQKNYTPEITLEIVDFKNSDYNRIVCLCCGGVNREVSDIFFDNFDDELDTVYDLIQVGLVEKVEGK